jgi:hypothetical protein
MADSTDAYRPVLPVKVGVTRWIQFRALRDAGNALFDPTGWAIRGVAKRGTVDGDVVAEWVSGTPSGTQGLAEVIPADLTVDPTADPSELWVQLNISAAMSDAWNFHHAPLDVEVTEPTGDQRQEVFSALIETIMTTVH